MDLIWMVLGFGLSLASSFALVIAIVGGFALEVENMEIKDGTVGFWFFWFSVLLAVLSPIAVAWGIG